MAIAASTLDIANLVVAACIPIAIFAAGAILAKQARKYEERQWTRRKNYETRLERWQEISLPLNDLLCFFMLFGHFRRVTPPDAIRLKRELDRAVHANEYVFKEKFVDAYSAFMALCFDSYAGGAGHDALIRASVEQQRRERGDAAWQDAWNGLFVPDQDASPRETISAAYNDLIRTYDEL